MSKKDYRIYEGEDIVWDDRAVYIKEVTESGMAVGMIAKSLREFRKKNNLTQTELAKRLEVSQVMVSKLERGDYNPTLNQLLKISYKLTRSNKMFIDMLKSITKIIKEDYTYNYDNVTVKNKSKNSAAKIVKANKRKTVRKQKVV